ncbi:MAG: DNA gyrase subunit A [Patescibacteria group bacterium]|nr:DNA gyrase subunit A [Patescibacteria group bacterium]MDD5490857.1 DNA gyrase subunit A [Patescibacteria group bacterium]
MFKKKSLPRGKDKPKSKPTEKVNEKIAEPAGEEKEMISNIGKVEQRPIIEEMQESYLDYAMSVIIARALPDVRDGLKPVHRRILYAMWDIGLKPSAKFRKSATIVGEVLGKYHPHGDTAVYDSMVRMAQDFSLRYPLVWGQGNFGSLDGDSAAAYRYTEAKLAPISEEMLLDIEKETVNFRPNFDGSHAEPAVMPSKLPNLLLNGTMGIAVGMATNIPPHNLTELGNGLIHLIDNPNCSTEDLMEHIKGPDFPTRGIIYDINAIKEAYATGRGSIVMRAKTEIVEAKSGNYNIIVTEIPYQVNKSSLIEKIAALVQDKKIEGIKDLRDESSKGEVRIVIELKKDVFAKKILNRLFNLTQLQETFHVNMLALVDGIQPKVLTLKMVLEEYVKHRQEVVRRRVSFDLERAKERAHILEGLVLALKSIDKIIATIKKSRDKDDAKKNLVQQFRLSDRQAVAILEMKLQQLANLERIKVEQELKEKKKIIQELSEILKSPKRILGIIKDEIKALVAKFGDERRTEIVPHPVGEFRAEDLIPDESTIILITRDGYIKRLPPTTFKTQSRGGKGVIGLTTKEEDVVEQVLTTTTHKDLLFFTTRGRVFQLKAYDVPLTSRTAKGQAIVNFLQLASNEKVSAIISTAEISDYKYLVMVTKGGLIKKADVKDFEKVRRSGLIAIKLKGDDLLEWVKPSGGNDEIILVTSNGQSIRFKESKVRPMGRAAAGVRGIRLKGKDMVVGMDVVVSSMVSKGMLELFVVMGKGYGKKTNLKFYKVQGRGGSGIKTAAITDKNGKIIFSEVVNSKDERDILVISANGQVIRIPSKSVSSLGRATQGVRIMKFKEASDYVASVAFI